MAITLTDAAVDRVKRFLGAEQSSPSVRFAVRPTGCSGWSYVVEPVEQVDPEDVVFEERGVRVVVHPKSLPFLDGMEVDYGRDGLNEGFRFRNPNVKASCGCGESFSV